MRFVPPWGNSGVLRRTWAASRSAFWKFVDVCRAELGEVHFSKKSFAELLRSKKTLKMNESRLDGRLFKKDRSKKFVFKKKLEIFQKTKNSPKVPQKFRKFYNEKSMEIKKITKIPKSISIDFPLYIFRIF